jgi:hypothetical protein
MICYEKSCAKIGPDDWILLSQSPICGWTFGIWGTDGGLKGTFGDISEEDAKEKALVAAKLHLAAHGWKNEAAALSALSWRVVVRHYPSEILDTSDAA